MDLCLLSALVKRNFDQIVFALNLSYPTHQAEVSLIEADRLTADFNLAFGEIANTLVKLVKRIVGVDAAHEDGEWQDFGLLVVRFVKSAAIVVKGTALHAVRRNHDVYFRRATEDTLLHKLYQRSVHELFPLGLVTELVIALHLKVSTFQVAKDSVD